MFKTIEEANEYKLKVDKELADLKLAKEGVETKLTETQNLVNDHLKEIDRLKVKNYDLFTQVATQQDKQTLDDEEQPESTTTIDDILKEI